MVLYYHFFKHRKRFTLPYNRLRLEFYTNVNASNFTLCDIRTTNICASGDEEVFYFDSIHINSIPSSSVYGQCNTIYKSPFYVANFCTEILPNIEKRQKRKMVVVSYSSYKSTSEIIRNHSATSILIVKSKVGPYNTIII